MSDDSKVSAPILDMTGNTVGEYEFDGNDLADRISKQLLHDAVVMYEANRRQGTFKTKTRGEVAGRGAKMFRQKGTGNARMGTKQSPVRVGGGHAFAKTPRDFSYRLPKKALRTATRMALLSKFQDKEAFVLKGFQVTEPKTKQIAQLLNNAGVGSKSALLVIAEHDIDTWRSARNIPNLWVAPLRDMNSYSLLHQKNVLITEEALELVRSGQIEPQEAVAAE